MSCGRTWGLGAGSFLSSSSLNLYSGAIEPSLSPTRTASSSLCFFSYRKKESKSVKCHVWPLEKMRSVGILQRWSVRVWAWGVLVWVHPPVECHSERWVHPEAWRHAVARTRDETRIILMKKMSGGSSFVRTLDQRVQNPKMCKLQLAVDEFKVSLSCPGGTILSSYLQYAKYYGKGKA